MLTIILDRSCRYLIFTSCLRAFKNLLWRFCKQRWDSQTRFSINHEASVMHVLSDAVYVTHSLSVRRVTPAPPSFASCREVAFSRRSHHISAPDALLASNQTLNLPYPLQTFHPNYLFLSLSLYFDASTLVDSAKTVDFYSRVLVWMGSGVDSELIMVIFKRDSQQLASWAQRVLDAGHYRPSGRNQRVLGRAKWCIWEEYVHLIPPIKTLRIRKQTLTQMARVWLVRSN